MAVYPNTCEMVANPYSYGFGNSRFVEGYKAKYAHWRNRFDSENYYAGASTPVGYGPLGALVLATSFAGMGTTPSDRLTSANTVTAKLWATRQLAASLSSVNTLEANAALVVAMAASILSANTVNAGLNMTLALAANLASQGNITAALSAIAYCVAEMTSDGNLDASNLRGTARMEATLSTEGTVTTARACAEAVWSALATQFNVNGTMGYKLNSASAAGDPWTADPASYSAGTAGASLVLASKALKLGEFVALK